LVEKKVTLGARRLECFESIRTDSDSIGTRRISPYRRSGWEFGRGWFNRNNVIRSGGQKSNEIVIIIFRELENEQELVSES
jgi:hypothetical protein